MSIALTHHSPVVLEGMCAAVRERFQGETIVAFETCDSLLTDLSVTTNIAVIDVALCPDSGIEVFTLLTTHGTSGIALLGAASDEPLRLLEVGVQGIVLPEDGIEGVFAAIDAVRAGHMHLPPHLLGTVLKSLIVKRRAEDEESSRLESLSPRELETLRMLVSGLDHRAMAARMVISPHTAKTHINRVLRKLGVRSRVEAAALAVHLGVEGIEP